MLDAHFALLQLHILINWKNFTAKSVFQSSNYFWYQNVFEIIKSFLTRNVSFDTTAITQAEKWNYIANHNKTSDNFPTKHENLTFLSCVFRKYKSYSASFYENHPCLFFLPSYRSENFYWKLKYTFKMLMLERNGIRLSTSKISQENSVNSLGTLCTAYFQPLDMQTCGAISNCL